MRRYITGAAIGVYYRRTALYCARRLLVKQGAQGDAFLARLVDVAGRLQPGLDGTTIRNRLSAD